MINLVEILKGKLLLEKRVEQYNKVSEKLNLLKQTFPLWERKGFSSNNAWLAGFYEGEGYFHVNSKTLQMSITISQKDKRLLTDIQKEIGGSIFYDKSWDGWLYTASSIKDLGRWISYFSQFPLISWKQVQLIRFKRLLLYKHRKAHLAKNKGSKESIRFFRLLSSFKKITSEKNKSCPSRKIL